MRILKKPLQIGLNGKTEKKKGEKADGRKAVKIVLKSVGCRTNQNEISGLELALNTCGYSIVDEISEGTDIVVVNSCSVTSCAESKTKRLIRRIKREAPNSKILVTGCLAQQKPDELIKKEGVNWVVGNTYKQNIPEIIYRYDDGVFHSQVSADAPVGMYSDGGIISEFRARRSRFSIKIQEGCDHRCSYCIVPFLRGPSRCLSKEKVISICRKAVERGFKEIVLTGTHIGQYNNGESYCLVDLIGDLLAVGGDFRIRLSSLDPRNISDDLLELIGRDPSMCDHLHISAQSLCGDILRGMNRPYKYLDIFLDRISNFHFTFPSVCIGGDFIVGFPGETDEMYETTLRNIERAGFSYGHVFRFSKRPGTAAVNLPQQIADKIIKERSDNLRYLLLEKHKKFAQSQIDKSFVIIVEKEQPVSGITSNYLKVDVPYAKAERNSWLQVVIRKYDLYKRRFVAEPVKGWTYG